MSAYDVWAETLLLRVAEALPIVVACDQIERLRKEWDESLHPRDTGGRFGQGGGSAALSPELASALDNWFDFESASAIKEVSAGRSLDDFRTSGGETLSEDDKQTLAAQAKLIQDAASQTNSGHTSVYRGIAVESEADLKQFKYGSTFTTNGLTATAVDRDIATTYAQGYADTIAGKGVLMEFYNKDGITGIERPATEENPGGEVIMPHGTDFRISSKPEDMGNGVYLVRLAAKTGGK